ncbi:MAG: helix-turn-helix domain protein [Bacteroidetes bacterium]|nr:helix-turn-helix domain protein [Bacteroidota bacterium]
MCGYDKDPNRNSLQSRYGKNRRLLPLVDDGTPLTEKNLIELDLLSGLVEEYEDAHYPIKTPSLADVIK